MIGKDGAAGQAVHEVGADEDNAIHLNLGENSEGGRKIAVAGIGNDAAVTVSVQLLLNIECKGIIVGKPDIPHNYAGQVHGIIDQAPGYGAGDVIMPLQYCRYPLTGFGADVWFVIDHPGNRCSGYARLLCNIINIH